MALVTAPAFNHTYGVQEAEICNKALSRIGSNLIMDTLEDTKQSKVCKIVYGQTRDELLRQYPFSFAVKTALIPIDASFASPKDQYAFAYNIDAPIAFTANTTVGGVTLANVVMPTGYGVADLMDRSVSGVGIPLGARVISYDDIAATATIDIPTTALGTTVACTARIAPLKLLEIAGNAENLFDIVAGPAGRMILCNMYSDIDPDLGYVLEIKYVQQVKDPALFDSMFVDALSLRIASKIAMDIAKSANLVQQMQGEFAAIMQLAKNATAEERQIDAPDPWWTEQRELGKNEMQRRMS